MSQDKKHDSIKNYGVIYKQIPGYDFDYYITTDGRVWTNQRKNGIERFMKFQVHKDNYLHVGLYQNGKQKIKRVHRLVAEAFIPNPDGKPYINHKDGNRQNNDVSNLEWCTQAENVRHSISVLGKWSNSDRQREKASEIGKKNRKLDMDTAKKIREEYASGSTSSLKLSRKYGLSKPCVLRILHNESYKE